MIDRHSIQRVVIAGGGTGGHLFPGIAVLEELRRRNPDLEVCFVGTEKGIESRVVPQLGERLEVLDVRPLKGTDAAGFAKDFTKPACARSRSCASCSPMW